MKNVFLNWFDIVCSYIIVQNYALQKIFNNMWAYLYLNSLQQICEYKITSSLIFSDLT